MMTKTTEAEGKKKPISCVSRSSLCFHYQHLNLAAANFHNKNNGHSHWPLYVLTRITHKLDNWNVILMVWGSFRLFWTHRLIQR